MPGNKRRRPPASETETSPLPQSGAQSGAENGKEPRTRGAIACDKCRSRKTRCDGARPSCGYCTHNDHDCVYPDSANNQVLDAIRDLSALVETKHNVCSICSASLVNDTIVYRPGQSTATPDHFHGPATAYSASDSAQGHARPGSAVSQALLKPLSGVAQPPLKPRGIETILGWGSLSHLDRQRCFYASENAPALAPSSVPGLNVDKLCHLESKYIDGVHSKNPALDLATLHHLVLDVAENGLDWSSRTCLVCLVLAIGAISQQYQDQHLSPENLLTPGAPQVTPATSPALAGTEPDLALQFWGIAAKRLGLVIGQRDVQAVQCLCLTGIWYMYQMEPIQAWQYFNLAGSAWYAINMIDHATSGDDPSSTNAGSFTTMQALYFTIWKSVCELRLEIDLPGVFDHVGLPYDFPLAPESDDIEGLSQVSSSERIWYYYLTEIAARHQINRIVNSMNWSCNEPTSKEVRSMLSLADTLEAQVRDWHTSLPPFFYFGIPDDFVLTPHPDDMTQILRSRYLTCRELIGRAFVWLCLETPLAYEDSLRQRSTAYANQCLRFCMLKLCQVAPHRHQGTWYGLRNAAAASLTLCAVNSAQRKPWSRVPSELELPDNWHGRATQTVEVLGPLWNEHNGGAEQIGLLLRSALAASSSA